MQEFEAVYTQYYLRVYKYVLTLCREPGMAEEITQDAFFRAFQNIEKFKGNCEISTWLCEIARNCYFSHLKRMRTQRKYSGDETQPTVYPEEKLLKTEQAYDLHRILHGLKEPYKEVFWLKTFGELSFKQIAGLFEKSENWARVTYYRAKLKIREEIK